MANLAARHVVLALTAALSLRVSHGQCSELGRAERDRLISYVQAKYKVPSGVSLELTELPNSGANCFRKLQFSSRDPTNPSRIDLSSPPDLPFLMHDLIDSRLDPVKEEAERQRAFAAGLTAGTFPVLGSNDAPITLT